MTEQSAADGLHDGELDPDAVLGTCTSGDVQFTDDAETPVNVLSDGTPANSQVIVYEAQYVFAASSGTDTPRIALPAAVETRIGIRSKP